MRKDVDSLMLEMWAALIEAEKALADYIPTIERTGAMLTYGKNVLARIRAVLAKAQGQ